MARPFRHRKELVLLLVAVLTTLFVLEIVARVIPEKAMFEDNKFSDPVLGWKRVAGTETYVVEDTLGNQRNVTATFEEHGFKRWGSVSTNKTKILVVGDSFTEMRYVNNGEEWYSFIEKELPVELFVYGAGGYGTTQEYLVVHEYIDAIQPDIVLLQFFRNDVVNNYYPADRREYPLSSLQLRPYLQKNEIVYRYPAPGDWIRRHSALARLVYRAYDRAKYNDAQQHRDAYLRDIYGEQDWERPFAENAIWDGQWSQSRSSTIDILRLLKSRVGDAQLIVFTVDNRWREEHEALFGEANVTATFGAADALDKAEQSEISVKVVNDSHWNREGNRVVGEYLVQYLQAALP